MAASRAGCCHLACVPWCTHATWHLQASATLLLSTYRYHRDGFSANEHSAMQQCRPPFTAAWLHCCRDAAGRPVRQIRVSFCATSKLKRIGRLQGQLYPEMQLGRLLSTRMPGLQAAQQSSVLAQQCSSPGSSGLLHGCTRAHTWLCCLCARLCLPCNQEARRQTSKGSFLQDCT